jgi:hypothetical protein
MVMKIYIASGLLLAFLFASTSAHAVPMTGTNWQVQNVSNNQAPAVFLAWTNVGDPRIGGVNKGVLTVSKIYDSAHLGPVSLLFSQVTPTTPDSGGFSTFGLAFWLDEKISNGSTSPMTGLTMKLADGASESALRQFRQILSVEQGSRLGSHPEAAHFHTIQNPLATADPWEITPNPDAAESALELDLGGGVLAPGAPPGSVSNMRIHEWEFLLVPSGPLRSFTLTETFVTATPPTIILEALGFMGVAAAMALRRSRDRKHRTDSNV